MLQIDVVIKEDKDDGGYVASVPALPGCVSQGETMDEVIANIKEAIALWLETAQDEEEQKEAYQPGELVRLPLAFA